jgi:hypothetical protein
MAKLTSAERNKLPASSFGGPHRSYPMPDKAHAANAKARASQFASPELKAKIDAKADKVLARASGGCCGHVTMQQMIKRHGEGV